MRIPPRHWRDAHPPSPTTPTPPPGIGEVGSADGMRLLPASSGPARRSAAALVLFLLKNVAGDIRREAAGALRSSWRLSTATSHARFLWDAAGRWRCQTRDSTLLWGASWWGRLAPHSRAAAGLCLELELLFGTIVQTLVREIGWRCQG